ncbi:nitrous oxide reductase family maturation protein NosD [Marivirga harenae]|uniref:nitrous oxide reductase family maturation protein NosD n=1 Tax=Marivirga harenae TaxID=2010992 RepID=UPI0026DEAA0C|nr:nitrous oxide reductase family maturation protein NosD [Marivirga harenae]WKV12977.1 nitrous oxide reductase family maturation protein NosD [Marivirga harenae]
MIRYFLSAFFFAILFSASLSAKPIIANSNNSIKESILQAIAYDTIIIKPGVYYENLISIEKPLTIIGEVGAIVDSQEGDEIFIVQSDGVIIQNLTLKNIGVSYIKDRAAIRLNRVRDVKILNNTLINTFFGIYLQKSNNCIVDGNKVIGGAQDESTAGNAIHIWQGKRIQVTNNEVSFHRDGIYFEFVDESYIANNLSKNNMRYGLHFMFSNYDQYENNRFQDNGSGVAVMFSKHIEMRDNQFLDNWGGASYGLLLKEISDGSIENNNFSRNTVGIYAEGANRLSIKSNLFHNNGKAMDIKGNSLDNQIIKNDFVGNTFEVLTNSKSNLNHFEGNYWSQYSGYDLNKDGIGDVPHRPVNLFAIVTDKIPAASMLLHSFLVNSLDAAERLFPQFIPEQLIDQKPKIKPNHYDQD